VSELLLARFPALREPRPVEILDVSRKGGPVLQQVYAEHLRNHELLKGAAVSFLVLAAGSLTEFRNLQPFGHLAWLGAAGAVLLAVLSVAFAHRSAFKASSLAAVVQTSDTA
jgi:hypothetical protein